MAGREGLHLAELCVALCDGVICGFVAYREGELTWLYVHPEHYRRGIGRALLRHVLEALAGEATVEVLAGNEAALSLYFSEGFEVLRRVEKRLARTGQRLASGYLLQRANRRG